MGFEISEYLFFYDFNSQICLYNDKSELDNLIHGPEAIEKWVLADIEKYKQEA